MSAPETANIAPHGESMRNQHVTTALAAILALAVGAAAAQGVRVAYVNTARIQKESVQSQRANEAMKKEFGPRERQIIEMQKQIKADQDRFEAGRKTLPPAELKALGAAIATRMRESDQMVMAMTSEVDARRREYGARMLDDVRAVIKTIAEEGKYDLVVNDAVYARPAVDITDRVLKEMARRAK